MDKNVSGPTNLLQVDENGEPAGEPQQLEFYDVMETLMGMFDEGWEEVHSEVGAVIMWDTGDAYYLFINEAAD